MGLLMTRWVLQAPWCATVSAQIDHNAHSRWGGGVGGYLLDPIFLKTKAHTSTYLNHEHLSCVETDNGLTQHV